MMKIIAAIVLLTLLISCNNNSGTNTSAADTTGTLPAKVDSAVIMTAPPDTALNRMTDSVSRDRTIVADTNTRHTK